MNKFEKLIEYIINDEDSKARELFHDIVVEKSRDIYESIMDEESMGETVHGQDDVEEMVDSLGADESHTMEDDEEFGDEEEIGGDEFGGEEEFGHEEGEAEAHGEIEDQVMNIDAKLDELLAKFDEIMGDEGHSEEMPAEEPGIEHGDEEIGSEEGEEQFAEGTNPFAKSGKSGKSGSAASGKSGVSGKSGSGSAKSGKSGKGSAELMREYVDRIGDIYGGEGDAAEGTIVGANTGAKDKANVNTKSEVGPGADFGGKAVTSHGGNQDQDGKTPTKASNEYTKGEGTIKSGNVNVPGGKAAQKPTGEKYESEPEGQEGKSAGAGTGSKDKLNINKKSEIGGRVR